MHDIGYIFITLNFFISKKLPCQYNVGSGPDLYDQQSRTTEEESNNIKTIK